jgi:hypothetical protein
MQTDPLPAGRVLTFGSRDKLTMRLGRQTCSGGTLLDESAVAFGWMQFLLLKNRQQYKNLNN